MRRAGADHDDAENVVGSVDQTWSGCLFSSGEFRSPAGGGTIGVRDKASGEIFALAGLATELGGRSGGDSNIEEFTERRWLTVTPGPAHYPN